MLRLTDTRGPRVWPASARQPGKREFEQLAGRAGLSGFIELEGRTRLSKPFAAQQFQKLLRMASTQSRVVLTISTTIAEVPPSADSPLFQSIGLCA
jgi:hypothetical protein